MSLELDLVKWIADQQKAVLVPNESLVLGVNGRVHRILDPTPACLRLSTLDSLAEYLKDTGPESWQEWRVVVRPGEVRVLDLKERPLNQADALHPSCYKIPTLVLVHSHPVAVWPSGPMSLELALRKLPQAFYPGRGDFAKLSALLGNVTKVAEVSTVDDGLSQKLEVRQKVAVATSELTPYYLLVGRDVWPELLSQDPKDDSLATSWMVRFTNDNPNMIQVILEPTQSLASVCWSLRLAIAKFLKDRGVEIQVLA